MKNSYTAFIGIVSRGL